MSSGIQPGQQHIVRISSRDVPVQVTSRVIVRGEWWNCQELESGRTRLVHSSEFRRIRPKARAGQRSRSRWPTAAGILLAALMVYLLSAGPVYSMHRREAISESTFDTVYWPIVQLANSHDTLYSVVRWYADWWA